MRNEDLRIGNLVNGLYEDGDGKTLSTVCKVLAVDSTESLGDGWGALLLSVDELEIDEFTDYNPIPLTEDWLKRFGFKFCSIDNLYEELKLSEFYGGVWWIPGMYFIEKDGDKFTFYHCTDEDTYWQLQKVEYCHQLQNLIFALTGEELKLN